jgi:hypothetical protein
MADRESMGWNFYDAFNKYTDQKMFQNQIKMYDRFVDVFHVHNEPDHLVEWVREISDKPIIYDCHDLQSMRTGADPDMNEIAAFELSDYVIHVSEPIAKQAEETHGPHDHSIIKSWVNERFFSVDPIQPAWKSICYQGGLSNTDNVDGLVSYRYQLPWAAWAVKQGYHVTMYAANRGDYSNYVPYGIIVHQVLPYPEMFVALQLHSMGFVGSTVKIPIMMQAVPNKLFEYMSQGVVPIIHWADEAWNQIKDLDCGVNINNIENLEDQLGDIKKLYKNVLQARWNFVFEKQIPEIVKIYERVLS